MQPACRSTCTSAARTRGCCPSPASTSSTAGGTRTIPSTSRNSRSRRTTRPRSPRRCAWASRRSTRCARLLKDQGKSTGIGDEGGFAPDLATNEEAVELILAAIEKAGYRPGADIALCLDPATSEMWNDGGYVAFKSDQSVRTTAEMIALWSAWIDRYPIVLIEDALAENDWDGWAQLTAALGAKIELVGDDVFCTNPAILRRAIDGGVGNSILVKLNQIGTVSETLETVRLAQANGYGAYMSHRSGETEDTFIADLAVATGCGHIKTGSGCRGERTAKFNRLLRIEHDLGDKATFPGLGGFRQAVL